MHIGCDVDLQWSAGTVLRRQTAISGGCYVIDWELLKDEHFVWVCVCGIDCYVCD